MKKQTYKMITKIKDLEVIEVKDIKINGSIVSFTYCNNGIRTYLPISSIEYWHKI